MTDNERKKSISALRQLLAMCDFVDQYGDSIVADPYFNAVETVIESLNETRWIPVSERLPSEDGKYLVYYEGTIIGSCIETMWYGEPLMPNVDVSGKHFYRSDAEWGDIVYDEVLAWMPLPEPYMEDGEEE